MQRPTLLRTLPLLSALSLLGSLTACAGDGDSGAAGQFLDSPVQGLAFRSAGLSGTTLANGAFEYEPGNTVEMAVGELVLGNARGRSRLTVVDLVPGAADQMNPTVTNIARFLQTIDDDADVSNGIEILPKVAALGTAGAVDFTLPVDEFEVDAAVTALISQMTALTTAGERPLVSTFAARAHLQSTLMALMAGEYRGGYGGNETGDWRVFVGTDHSVSGFGIVRQTSELFSVVGSAESDGSISFGNTSGSSFEGRIASQSISGDWDNRFTGNAGGFNGSQIKPTVLMLPAELIATVEGEYLGSFELESSAGPVIMQILSNGDVTMRIGGARASAAIGELVGDSVRVIGLTVDGTSFDGIADPFGGLLGQVMNAVTGERGTFEGEKL